MRLLKMIKKELLPLSSRQNLVLLLIISSIFQFTLFFAPTLAEAAVNQAQRKSEITAEEIIVFNPPLIKEGTPVQPTPQSFNDLAASSTELSAPGKSTDLSETKDGVGDAQNEIEEGYKVIRTSTHVITAYNSEIGQTDSTPCITANGFNVCKHGVEDTIAANFLKFGTKVQIPELFGEKVFIVRDRMNKKHPERVDIWMLNKQDALKFGKRTAKIVVIE